MTRELSSGLFQIIEYYFCLIIFIYLQRGEENNLKGNEVILLATIHGLHEKLSYYSYDTLETILYDLKPDVICAELSETRINEGKYMEEKVEYTEVILPYVEQNDCDILPMEPNGKTRIKLVENYNNIFKNFSENNPEKNEAIQGVFESIYDYVFEEIWKDPLTVNSDLSCHLFAVKHKIQEKMYGVEEEKAWELWNEYFADAIINAVEEYENKRLLVTCGAEHLYWLKNNLPKKGLTDVYLAGEYL